MPKRKPLVNKQKPNVGYKYDEGADEWSWKCPACKQTLYAPSKQALIKSNYYHARVKPIENRKCPQKW